MKRKKSFALFLASKCIAMFDVDRAGLSPALVSCFAG